MKPQRDFTAFGMRVRGVKKHANEERRLVQKVKYQEEETQQKKTNLVWGMLKRDDDTLFAQ